MVLSSCQPNHWHTRPLTAWSLHRPWILLESPIPVAPSGRFLVPLTWSMAFRAQCHPAWVSGEFCGLHVHVCDILGRVAQAVICHLLLRALHGIQKGGEMPCACSGGFPTTQTNPLHNYLIFTFISSLTSQCQCSLCNHLYGVLQADIKSARVGKLSTSCHLLSIITCLWCLAHSSHFLSFYLLLPEVQWLFNNYYFISIHLYGIFSPHIGSSSLTGLQWWDLQVSGLLGCPSFTWMFSLASSGRSSGCWRHPVAIVDKPAVLDWSLSYLEPWISHMRGFKRCVFLRADCAHFPSLPRRCFLCLLTPCFFF